MRCEVGLQVALEQAHQEVDLGAGPAQIVFQGKGVKREPGQADAGGGFSNQLHALGALLVAQEALERALPGPAAVAVHDDGHMLGQALGLQRRIDRALFFGQLIDAQRAGWIQRNRLNITFAAQRAGAQGASVIDAGRDCARSGLGASRPKQSPAHQSPSGAKYSDSRSRGVTSSTLAQAPMRCNRPSSGEFQTAPEGLKPEVILVQMRHATRPSPTRPRGPPGTPAPRSCPDTSGTAQ